MHVVYIIHSYLLPSLILTISERVGETGTTKDSNGAK